VGFYVGGGQEEGWFGDTCIWEKSRGGSGESRERLWCSGRGERELSVVSASKKTEERGRGKENGVKRNVIKEDGTPETRIKNGKPFVISN